MGAKPGFVSPPIGEDDCRLPVARTARASAVAYLYAALKRGATYEEVLAAAERDNAPFVSSEEITDWVPTSFEALG